jgi:hypothetical protein
MKANSGKPETGQMATEVEEATKCASRFGGWNTDDTDATVFQG